MWLGSIDPLCFLRWDPLNVCDVLEIGPGDAPLITDLADVPTERKHVIEFPGVIEKSRQLGFHCVEQDLIQRKMGTCLMLRWI